MRWNNIRRFVLGFVHWRLLAAAPASRCTAGILDDTQRHCCPKSCGKCGGIGCDRRPGGGSVCCGGSLKQSCYTSEGPPPCTYPLGWPQPESLSLQQRPLPSMTTASQCFGGVESSTGDACCSGDCGTCGGPGCNDRPGGAGNCCGSSIRQAGRICNESVGPPCVYIVHLHLSRCTAGILDAEGKVCCSKMCGRCGGVGCEARPGGGDHCCGTSIAHLCVSIAGMPPCRYASASTTTGGESQPLVRRCIGGIESRAGDACCPRACGICGGPHCDMRTGGASQCCGNSISKLCQSEAGPPPCRYKTVPVGRKGEL